MYRDMGPTRSIARVNRDNGKRAGWLRQLEDWSSDWNWVERARAYDDHLEAKAREIADRYLPMWEERRQVALERMMLLASKLLARGEAMLDHPMTKEVTRESSDGRTVYNIIEPAGWTWGAIATVIRTGAELQAAVIAEGLAESETEAFDVESASPEELKAFIEKTRRKR
jgi:hypothetical protein